MDEDSWRKAITMGKTGGMSVICPVFRYGGGRQDSVVAAESVVSAAAQWWLLPKKPKPGWVVCSGGTALAGSRVELLDRFDYLLWSADGDRAGRATAYHVAGNRDGNYRVAWHRVGDDAADIVAREYRAGYVEGSKELDDMRWRVWKEYYNSGGNHYEGANG